MTLFMHTPSAGGVVMHNGKILVITSAIRGSVDLPKGTIEDGESINDTAIREVEEETGYRVTIKGDLGSTTYDYFSADHDKAYRKTVSYFLMELADDLEPVKNLQDGEDFENEWLTPNEAIERLTYSDTKDFIRRALEFK